MGLPELYRATNEGTGHASNCSWGAGGDCTCGKFGPEYDEALWGGNKEEYDEWVNSHPECVSEERQAKLDADAYRAEHTETSNPALDLIDWGEDDVPF